MAIVCICVIGFQQKNKQSRDINTNYCFSSLKKVLFTLLSIITIFNFSLNLYSLKSLILMVGQMGKNQPKTEFEMKDSKSSNIFGDHRDKHLQTSTDDSNIEKLISKQASSALLSLLFYSILMFTLPFAAFFGIRHFLREHSDLSEFAITSLSVSSSVITVYIIIALYAYKAYNEKEVNLPAEKCEEKIEAETCSKKLK